MGALEIKDIIEAENEAKFRIERYQAETSRRIQDAERISSEYLEKRKEETVKVIEEMDQVSEREMEAERIQILHEAEISAFRIRKLSDARKEEAMRYVVEMVLGVR